MNHDENITKLIRFEKETLKMLLEIEKIRETYDEYPVSEEFDSLLIGFEELGNSFDHVYDAISSIED